jgi:hypothetical protein
MSASMGGLTLVILLSEWYGYLYWHIINWGNVGLTWLFLFRNCEALSVASLQRFC